MLFILGTCTFTLVYLGLCRGEVCGKLLITVQPQRFWIWIRLQYWITCTCWSIADHQPDFIGCFHDGKSVAFADLRQSSAHKCSQSAFWLYMYTHNAYKSTSPLDPSPYPGRTCACAPFRIICTQTGRQQWRIDISAKLSKLVMICRALCCAVLIVAFIHCLRRKKAAWPICCVCCRIA